MMDLAKLDIAIDDAKEFLELARKARYNLYAYEYLANTDYPIDHCAKVRAKSLDLYRSLVDLRRKESNRNVSLRETPR